MNVKCALWCAHVSQVEYMEVSGNSAYDAGTVAYIDLDQQREQPPFPARQQERSCAFIFPKNFATKAKQMKVVCYALNVEHDINETSCLYFLRIKFSTAQKISISIHRNSRILYVKCCFSAP